MEFIGIGFIISSFVAGLLMFLAPCTLPLVPAYLVFISGVSTNDLKDPAKAAGARKRIFWNGIFFILGFSIVFILFGTLAGIAGQKLGFYQVWLRRIGGLLITIFGLFILGVFNISFLQTERRIKLPSFLKLGKPSSSIVVGATFAVGWTPCVGPVLGSILLLASASATALKGAIMLAVFSLGLAVPFILISLAFSKAIVYIEKITKYLNVISKISGALLIVLGVLLLTDSFTFIVQYSYDLFEFFNIDYGALLDYL